MHMYTLTCTWRFSTLESRLTTLLVNTASSIVGTEESYDMNNHNNYYVSVHDKNNHIALELKGIVSVL